MARLTFPSRLELKKPEGSFDSAPFANVILTAFVYVSPVHTIPPCDQTAFRGGRPHPFPLLDDLRVGLVDERSHLREHLSAPVTEFFDFVVDQV